MKNVYGTVVLAAMIAGGCATESGGGNPSQRASHPAEEGTTSQGGVPPEQIDAVQEVFRRKEQAVNSCYTAGIEETKNRKLEGKLMLSMVIKPSGRATDVKVLETTLNTPTIERCIIKLVEGWEFPKVAEKLPMTHSYAFKPAF
jgi:hypothetical protein